jgi:hemerythrin
MAAVINWTKELSVGVEEIDVQHQELFNRINALLSACETDLYSQETHELMGFLHTYVLEHFTAEETLMRTAGYPDEEAHRRQHLGFCRRLSELDRELLALPEPGLILNQLNEMVVDWLYEHICMEDRKLGEFLGRDD